MDNQENLKAIKLNDGHGTIIYIDKDANPEIERKKYQKNVRLSNLNDYEDSNYRQKQKVDKK